MDEYSQLVADYVLKAWERGKSTREIKEELLARRWPADMIELIIDRLVKKRVEDQEGKLQTLVGPDFWSQPTWPTSGGWNDTKKAALILTNNHSQPTLSNPIIDENYSENQNIIDNSQNNIKHFSKENSAQEDKNSVKIILPALEDNQETNIISNLTPSTEKSIENTPSNKDKIVNMNKKSVQNVLTRIKNNTTQDQKLPQKLEQQKLQTQKDTLIRRNAFLFLAILGVVIICALLWRIFVIK